MLYIELLYVGVPSASTLNPESEGINVCFQMQNYLLQKFGNDLARKITVASFFIE